MLGQVGLWAEDLDVAFGPQMLSWLDDMGTDRRVTLGALIVAYDDGRKFKHISVMADPEGQKVCTASPTMAYRHHVKFARVTYPADLEALDLPRFGLHEVEWHTSPHNPEHLTCALAADHFLPWPKLTDCKIYTAAEVLAEDVYKRLKSAVICGSKNLGEPMPDALRDRMPRGLWADALERAKAFTPQA